jgi:mannose-1-phosphate guanylyltransferase
MPLAASYEIAARNQENKIMSIAKDKVFAVIMAGGKGERLWPLSTEERPKPLISLNGQQTLLEDTVQRLFPLLNAENIFVITDEKSAVQAREILMLPAENIIAEPCRRNTAPCIALAAALVKRKCDDATMIVLPADHRIAPVKRFQEDLLDCIEEAQKGSLTILGVSPDKPATGYGYINAGEKIAPGIYKVSAFKEKPDFETAQHYMMDGNYWWNCGIFVWQVNSIAEAFKKYAPGLHEKFEAWATGKDYRTDFESCEKISIDYAVMEKADNVAVKQASFQWNDLGTLGALYEITMKDFHENAISTKGRLQLDEADQNLIFCDDDTEIRMENIKNCAIIKSGKALLITTKWR